MNGAYLEAIRVHYGEFDELTDCKCIMGKLVSQGLVDFHEKEELMLPSVTTMERNQKMMDFVRRKGNSKFDVLIQLLLTKECYREFAISLHKGTLRNFAMEIEYQKLSCQACYGKEPAIASDTSPESETVEPIEAQDDQASPGRPMMSELIKDLVPHLAAHWKKFAYITDTPQHIIDQIHMDHIQFGVHSCCSAFLSMWLQNKPNVTWDDVIKALYDINLVDTAEDLHKKYLN